MCIKSVKSAASFFLSLKDPGHDQGLWWLLRLLGAGWGCGCGSGWVQMCPDSGSRLQNLISPVRVSLENTPALSVCQYSLSGVATASLLEVYSLSQ